MEHLKSRGTTVALQNVLAQNSTPEILSCSVLETLQKKFSATEEEIAIYSMLPCLHFEVIALSRLILYKCQEGLEDPKLMRDFETNDRSLRERNRVKTNVAEKSLCPETKYYSLLENILGVKETLTHIIGFEVCTCFS